MQYPGAGPAPSVKGRQKSSKSSKTEIASIFSQLMELKPAASTIAVKGSGRQKIKRLSSESSSAPKSSDTAALQKTLMNSTPPRSSDRKSTRLNSSHVAI